MGSDCQPDVERCKTAVDV